MSTVVTDGKLVSMTLSDRVYVSANIIPEDESLGQQLISLEKFDLLKIHEAQYVAEISRQTSCAPSKELSDYHFCGST